MDYIVTPMEVDEQQQQQTTLIVSEDQQPPPQQVVLDDVLNDPIYPTPGINKLYEELKLVSDSGDKTLSTLFDQKYRISTEFTDLSPIQFIVDFVKLNIDAMKSPHSVQLVLKELKVNCELHGIPVNDGIAFSFTILKRVISNQPVFITHTKNKTTYNMYDMNEHPSNYKRRTTKECGHCRKKENLQLCARCKTAAYCCKDCQKLDYGFHKTYCVMYCNKK